MVPQNGTAKDILVIIAVFALSIALIAGTLFATSRLYDYKIRYLEGKVSALESQMASQPPSSSTINELGEIQDFQDVWKIRGDDLDIARLAQASIEKNDGHYLPIYFFKNGACENECKDQAFVLDYVRLKHKGKTLIIELDTNTNNTFVQNLIHKYNIKKTPSVVINGEKFEEHVPAGAIESRLDNFLAQKYAIVIVDGVQAEDSKAVVFNLLDGFSDAGIPLTLGVVPKSQFNFCEDAALYSRVNSADNIEVAQQSRPDGMRQGLAELEKCLERVPKTFVDFNTITPDTLISASALNFEAIITAHDYYANKRDAFGLFHVAATTS